MKEETSVEIKKFIDEAERELREKFDELIFDYGDNDGQYFLHNRASGFNVLLEYARKWQKAKEAEYKEYSHMEDDKIEKLEKKIERLEERQRELEVELRRLANRLDSRIAFENDREDYLEILNDTHGYYDY